MSSSGAPLGKEDRLNLAFANKAADSRDFITWLLQHTKFRKFAQAARLLNDEQEKARSARFWWRHWWCTLPDLGGDSETDILLAFEGPEGARFCLHIENKLAASSFTPKQEANYAIRAKYMLTHTKFAKLRCTDFDTVLIAPRVFQQRYPIHAGAFGAFIPHEKISLFVPEFADDHYRPTSLSESQASSANELRAAQSRGLRNGDAQSSNAASHSANINSYRCPTCQSENTQRQAILYNSGTAKYTSTSISTGVGARGRLRLTTSEGRKSSSLADKYAPPSKRTFPAMGCLTVVLVGAGVLAVTVNVPAAIGFIAVAVVFALSASKQNGTYNRVVHPQKFDAWADAFVCLRCGERFHPDVDKIVGEGRLNVVLEDIGPRKINVIKVLRAATGLGLKEAKDLAEAAPVSVASGLTVREASALKLALEGVGANVSLRKEISYRR